MIFVQFVETICEKGEMMVKVAGMDIYGVGYKIFTTEKDKRLGTKNFEQKSCKIQIKATNTSHAGMAKNKFFQGLALKDRKKTVVTGAIMY